MFRVKLHRSHPLFIRCNRLSERGILILATKQGQSNPCRSLSIPWLEYKWVEERIHWIDQCLLREVKAVKPLLDLWIFNWFCWSFKNWTAVGQDKIQSSKPDSKIVFEYLELVASHPIAAWIWTRTSYATTLRQCAFLRIVRLARLLFARFQAASQNRVTIWHQWDWSRTLGAGINRSPPQLRQCLTCGNTKQDLFGYYSWQ